MTIARTLVTLAVLAAGCRGPAAAHIERGDRALAAGRYAEALAAYSHARELLPTDAAVQQGILRARVFLAAEQPLRITAEGAEDLRYEARYLADSDSARAAVYLTALANIAWRTGHIEEAKARYDAALKADPNSGIANTALGVFLLGQQGGADEAKERFEKVLKSKPDAVVPLVGLGQIALGDNQYDVAAQRLEAALKVGDDFTARMLLGAARQKQNKSDEAAGNYLRATQLDPRSVEALRAYGQALLSASRLEDAERALRQAAAMSADPQTMLALGFTLERQNQSDQALGLFNAVLQQNARDGPALYGAGAALEQLGKKTDALAIYKRLGALPAGQGPAAQLIAQLQQQAAQRSAVLEGRAPEPQRQQPPPQAAMSGAPTPGRTSR